MNLDWKHLVLAGIIAAATITLLQLKLIGETSAMSVLMALVGVLIPSNYKKIFGSSTPDSTTSTEVPPSENP